MSHAIDAKDGGNNIQMEGGSLPFFARFLEGQLSESGSAVKNPSAVCANRRQEIGTTKYPSDRDEYDPYLNF